MPATVSISEAKQRLGEIADRALEGEQIVIVRKSKLLVLKQLGNPRTGAAASRTDTLMTAMIKRKRRLSKEPAARSARKLVK